MSELKDKLQGFTKLAVIGVGSDIRNDDAAGIHIANQLKETLKDERVEILIGGTTPENLTGVLKRMAPSHILLVDAAQMRKAPGTIEIIDPEKIKGEGFSTHTFSLRELAHYLQETTKAKIVVMGIEPKDINFGETLSEEVKQAVLLAVSQIQGSLL